MGEKEGSRKWDMRRRRDDRRYVSIVGPTMCCGGKNRPGGRKLAVNCKLSIALVGGLDLGFVSSGGGLVCCAAISAFSIVQTTIVEGLAPSNGECVLLYY